VEKQAKKPFVEALKAEINQSHLVIVTRSSGLSVPESQALRTQMRADGAQYKVAKNTLIRLAVQDTPYAVLLAHFKGPTALAYSVDPIAAAKAAVTFSKKNEKMQIVCGAMGDRFLDAAEVKALAALPSLDELRGTLIGLLQAPAGKLARIAQAPAAQLARILFAYSEKGN